MKIQATLLQPASLRSLIAGLSDQQLRRAAQRGFNEHLRLQERMTIKVMAASTIRNTGRVDKATSVRLAGGGGASDEGAIRVQDKPIAAGLYTSRSWSRSMTGAKHGDWPGFSARGGSMKGTFVIKKYGGAIFKRTGDKRFPVKKIWGPFLPNELLRNDMPTLKNAKRLVDQDLQARVLRHLAMALGGR